MHLTFTYKILAIDWPGQVILEKNPQMHVHRERDVDSTLDMAICIFNIEFI